MPQLQWRDVAAPDFSTSMNGIKAFNDIFDHALGQARSTVNDLDQAQTDRFNKGMMLTLAGLQDPAAAKAAIPDLLARAAADPNRVSNATLSAINARPGELLSQATQQFNFDKGQHEYARALGFEQASDAAKPIIAKAASLAYAGDRAGSQKVLDDNAALVGKMKLDDVLGSMRDNSAFSRDAQSYNQGQTRWGWEQNDRNEGRQATAIMQDVIAHASSPETAETYLSSLKVDPNVLAKVRAGLQLPTFPAFTPDPSFGAPTMAANGDDPSRIMNYQARAAGFGAVPSTVQNFGQASSFADQVNRAGVPSSAMGVYEMVGNTQDAYAKKVFGADWKNVPYTVQNQDKLAEQVFKDNNGSNAALRKQWTSLNKLPDAQVDQLRQMPWEQARIVIATHEAGAQAAANANALLHAASDAAGKSYTDGKASGDLSANNTALRFTQAMNDPRPASEVAAELRKSYPDPDVTYDIVLGKIREIQARAKDEGVKLTPAAAADMLKTAAAPRSLATKAWDLITPGHSLGYNSDQVDALIANAKPGKDGMSQNEKVVRGVTVVQGSQGQQSLAAKALSDAAIALQQGQAAARAGRNVNLAPLQDRFNKAQAMIYGAAHGTDSQTQSNSAAQTATAPQVVARKVAAPPPPKPAAKPGVPAPTDHSSAAARARMSAMLSSVTPSVHSSWINLFN